VATVVVVVLVVVVVVVPRREVEVQQVLGRIQEWDDNTVVVVLGCTVENKRRCMERVKRRRMRDDDEKWMCRMGFNWGYPFLGWVSGIVFT
jgi:heme exporter protein D